MGAGAGRGSVGEGRRRSTGSTGGRETEVRVDCMKE